jgi:serine/threonine-protein kinase OSR1/STK39
LTDEDHTHTHVNDKASRAVIFDPDVSSPPRRSRVGKRRSFVGTVRSFPLSQDLIVLNSISHVGWLQNLFPASITTRAPISGPSVSRPSSWLRGVLPGHESPLVQSFLRCESPAIIPGNISSLKLNLITGSVEAAPPTLDRQGGVHKYSRAFKETVERCLVKDPSLRFTLFKLPHVLALTTCCTGQRLRSSSKPHFSRTQRNPDTSSEAYSVCNFFLSHPLLIVGCR